MVPDLVGRDPPTPRHPPCRDVRHAGVFRRGERDHGEPPVMITAETAIREAFAVQAGSCAERGSPFTGRLCEVLDWSGRPDARGDSVPLRLAGGLHALVRRRRLPRLAAMYPPNPPPEAEPLGAALADALSDADADLLPWLDRPPQTNEPMRSAPLMAGLLVIAAETGGLHELGASAGLVLVLTATSTAWAA